MSACTPSLVEAALDYAALRMPVFPCAPRGKEPAIARGFHAATTNPETIKRLWRQADRNIGIPTGTASGLWVLDIDGDDGAASVASLEAKHSKLPPTWESTTGRGRHFWFKYAGPIGNSAGRVAPGIDVRGDGGYVLAPPSVHPRGRIYTFTLRDGAPASAPDWLERLARTKPQSISERAMEKVYRGDTSRSAAQSKAYGQAALDAEITSLAAALPGTRNDALNCTAFRLFQLVAGGELDDGQVIERLIDACHRNQLVEDDGWRTVMATIRSARAGLKHPRSRSGAV